jgi:YVTN family beta-propeller protein
MSIHDVNPGSAGFGTRIGAVPTGGHAEGMATDPEGRVYFATSDFVVTAVDTATDRVVATIRTTSGSHNLAAAPGRLYAPLHGTSLAILDTDAAVVAANIPIRVESPGAYVTANTDGSRIYLSRREEGILSVFDPATNTIIASVRVGDGAVAPAAVSADGSLVAVPVGDSVTIVSTGRNIEV